jgi:hypothetical protein
MNRRNLCDGISSNGVDAAKRWGGKKVPAGRRG